LSGRGLCDELITRPEESYRLCCIVVCDLETSRIGAPHIYIYIHDISNLRVKKFFLLYSSHLQLRKFPNCRFRLKKSFNDLLRNRKMKKSGILCKNRLGYDTVYFGTYVIDVMVSGLSRL